MGFTPAEVNMLEVFWNPVFNKKWMVLERDNIKKWFCGNNTNPSAVDNFHKRVLLRKYTEGADFKEYLAKLPNNSRGRPKIIYESWLDKNVGIQDSYAGKLRKVITMFCNYPRLKTLGISFSELYQRRQMIHNMLTVDKKIAGYWKG